MWQSQEREEYYFTLPQDKSFPVRHVTTAFSVLMFSSSCGDKHINATRLASRDRLQFSYPSSVKNSLIFLSVGDRYLMLTRAYQTGLLNQCNVEAVYCKVQLSNWRSSGVMHIYNLLALMSYFRKLHLPPLFVYSNEALCVVYSEQYAFSTRVSKIMSLKRTFVSHINNNKIWVRFLYNFKSTYT